MTPGKTPTSMPIPRQFCLAMSSGSLLEISCLMLFSEYMFSTPSLNCAVMAHTSKQTSCTVHFMRQKQQCHTVIDKHRRSPHGNQQPQNANTKMIANVHGAHHLVVLMAGLCLAAAISGEVLRRFATLCSGRDTAPASCILCTCRQAAC